MMRLTLRTCRIVNQYLLPYPVFCALVFCSLAYTTAVLSYGVLNFDAILATYAKQHALPLPLTQVSPLLLRFVPLDSQYAHVLMFICHIGCTVLVMQLGLCLGLNRAMLWALLFLLSSHGLLNDYRQYIFIAPFYWLTVLLALRVALCESLPRNVSCLLVVLLLYLATAASVVAWGWLVLLPILFRCFGSAHIRRLPVLVYFSIVTTLFFLPHVLVDSSGFETVMTLIANRQQQVSEVGQVLASVWLQDENGVMSWLFLGMGSVSVVLLRSLFSLGFVALLLVVYGVLKRQFALLHPTRLRLFFVLIVIDILLTTLHVFIRPNYTSSAFFAHVLILLVLAAPGLAYVFAKIQQQRYHALTQLLIVWLLIGYMISGIVPFGPSNAYLRLAGEAYRAYPFVSNHHKVLFYGNKNPQQDVLPTLLPTNVWVLYQKGRDKTLPQALRNRQPIQVFQNRHDDKVLVFAPQKVTPDTP